MARFHIIKSVDAPDLFSTVLGDPSFARIEDHPFTSRYARLYYPAALGASCNDVSFLVVEDEKVVALVLATRQNQRLDYFGQPLSIVTSASVDVATAMAAETYAVETLNDMAAATDCRCVVVGDLYASRISATGEAALKFGGKPVLRLHAMADISGGEEMLRHGLRKSFRSLVNWGKRELSLSFVNKERAERADFDAYRAFHRKIAGRDTRPPESWDVMFNHIASGYGELVLAHLNGDLVAGTMFLDGKRISYYASGVYDREQFDKPLAHWPLWTGILRVAARGHAMVDLGHVPFDGEASNKEVNIGYFKRGFATHLEPRLVWEWRKHEANSSDPD